MEKPNEAAGAIVALPPVIESDAGTIQNLPLSMVDRYQQGPGVAVIHCKAGSVRSNHWHRRDWHYLYVISGEMEYHEAEMPQCNPIHVRLVKAGQMVFTAAGMAHATKFVVDTVLLSIARCPQDAMSRDGDCVKLERVLI